MSRPTMKRKVRYWASVRTTRHSTRTYRASPTSRRSLTTPTASWRGLAMLTVEQVRASVARPRSALDWAHVRQALAAHRSQQDVRADPELSIRLAQLVDAVLVSAPNWSRGADVDLLQRAAETAEMLALVEAEEGERSRFRFRAALLYELAALPMMAAAIVSDADGPEFLIDFIKRRQAFRALGAEIQ